jgi:NADPH2 dehydrogenase
MRYFTYKNLEELRSAVSAVNATHVGFLDETAAIQAALSKPVQVGHRKVGNSMAIHPMEGCDSTPDGKPDELTMRRYERFGRGGAKLIWFEATAVREEGRANPRQLVIAPHTLDSLREMLNVTLRAHKEEWGRTDDLLCPLQLTHSGRYSVPRRIIAYHNPLIDRKTNLGPDYPIITDDEIERLEDDYVTAAGLALEAGFNSVDIKVTHGYLMAELLGAKIRPGRYGGSLENRARMPLNIMGKIKAKYGDRLLLCMRLGCFDSVPYVKDEATGRGVPLPWNTPYNMGWGVSEENPLVEDLREVKTVIGWFQQAGLALLNISLGCPYYNPHIGRPFEKPDEGNYEEPEHPLAGVDRHFRIAGELQRSFPSLPMVGTGYSWLQKFAIHAGAKNLADKSIAFFGMGRNALAYPDFAADVLRKGELEELRVCKTVTFCTYLMRQKNHPLGQFPSGCPPFDKEVYGPIMKLARASQRTT